MILKHFIRVSFCATTFIVNNLGSKFVEPPVLDMRSVVEDTTNRTPLVFVLSPGVDPTGLFSSNFLSTCSLT